MAYKPVGVDETSHFPPRVETHIQDLIDAAIDALVNGAPDALDKLNEIADALNADESAAAALTTLVASIRDLSDAIALAAAKGVAGVQFGEGGPDRGTVTAATVNNALTNKGFYFLPPGVTTVTPSAGLGIQIPAGATLMGCGQSSVLRLAAGQPQIKALITNTDAALAVTGPMSRITLKDFVVDGNGAAGGSYSSPGGGSLQTAGIYLLRTPSLSVSNVHVVNCSAFRAFYMDGGGVGDNRDHVVTGVQCYENNATAAVFGISQTSRQTQLSDIHVYNNTSAAGTFPFAVFLDVSEMQANGIYSYNNSGYGIKINNVHSSTYANLTAMNNGADGILVEEFVRSSGSAWKACGNGRLGTPGTSGYAEVRFTATTDQSYGITRESEVIGIDTSTLIGTSSSPINGYRYADYGLYVGDGVTQRVTISGVQLGTAGHLARLRLPATMGELRVVLADGTTYPSVPGAVTNLFFADPSMASTVTATTNWTYQNATSSVTTFTLPDGSSVPVLKGVCTGSGAHQVFTKTAADVPVTAGTVYAFSAACATDAAITDIAMTGTWLDASHTALASGSVLSPDIRTSTRGLARFMVYGTAPAGAEFFRPKIDFRPQADVGSAQFWFTQIMVTTGAYTPDVYGDGDVTGWGWDGTARASTSTRVVPYTAQQTKANIDAKVPLTRTLSNGYGVSGGGDLSANRTLAVALTTATSTIGSDVTINAATLTDLTSVTLAVGTWRIDGIATVFVGATATAVDVGVELGTAVGTITGPGWTTNRQIASNSVSCAISCVVTVTTAGTLILRAQATNAATAKALTQVASKAGATGITATRIA